MIRFRFSLEPVLRVARIRQQCEWDKLQAIYMEVTSRRAALEAAVQKEVAARRELARAVRATVAAATVHVANDCLAAMQRGQEVLKQELDRAKHRLQEQQQLYLAARRRSEVLGALRASKYNEFVRELTRRDQLELDDMFLNRRR